MDSISLGLKDVFILVTTVSTIVSMYFALKYKAKRNGEINEETADSFKAFKDFVYKELKEIEKQLNQVSKSMSEMLDKSEAEKKYVPRAEHKLEMQSLNDKLELILEAVRSKG